MAYYFLPAIIHDYAERFPRIRVRIIDETAHTVLNSVVTGRADFGISFFGTQEPDVDFKAVLREDFVLAVRRDHPLAARRSVSWEELSQERFMTCLLYTSSASTAASPVRSSPRGPARQRGPALFCGDGSFRWISPSSEWRA